MSTASLTLFFQGFPAPQLYAAPGAWERGGCSKGWWQKGNSADFAFLLPWIKMGGGSKGRKPACFQPALPFLFVRSAFSGGKIHRAGNCLEAGKQERQEQGMALPARGKFRGPTKKAEDLGLTLFLSHPLHSCRQAWVAILRAARGHTKPVSVRGSSLFPALQRKAAPEACHCHQETRDPKPGRDTASCLAHWMRRS